MAIGAASSGSGTPAQLELAASGRMKVTRAPWLGPWQMSPWPRLDPTQSLDHAGDGELADGIQQLALHSPGQRLTPGDLRRHASNVAVELDCALVVAGLDDRAHLKHGGTLATA